MSTRLLLIDWVRKSRRLALAYVLLSLFIVALLPPIHAGDAQSFTRVGSLILGPGEEHVTCAVIDPVAGLAYFGTNNAPIGATKSPAMIAKVRLSDFSLVGALTLNPGENSVRTAAIDSVSGFAYFGIFRGIVKVRLSDFSRVAVLNLPPGEDPESSVIDFVGGFGYFGGGGGPGAIVKVRLSDFTLAATLPLQYGENNPESAFIDSTATYLYFGEASEPQKVLKFRLSDFSRVGNLTIAPNMYGQLPAVFDVATGFAYFGTPTPPGVIVKVRVSDLTRIASLSLDPGEGGPSSAVIDPTGNFAYFATWNGVLDSNVADSVIRVGLPDFTEVGSVIMNFGEKYMCCAVIDPGRGFAYFGATDYGRSINGTYPRVVIKVSIAAPPVSPLDTLRLWAPYFAPAVGISFVTAAALIRTRRRRRITRVSLAG